MTTTYAMDVTNSEKGILLRLKLNRKKIFVLFTVHACLCYAGAPFSTVVIGKAKLKLSYLSIIIIIIRHHIYRHDYMWMQFPHHPLSDYNHWNIEISKTPLKKFWRK